MPYKLELHPRARRYLEKLARSAQADSTRIEEAIDSLIENPRPARVTKLEGRAPLWKIRVGEYRIIYSIFDPDQLVTIEDIQRRTTTTYKDR